MTKLIVDLEPLANFYQGGPNLVKAIVKNAIACEIAGADGVLLGTGKDFDQKRRRAFSTLVESLDIPFYVKINAELRHIEPIVDTKPSMVILSYIAENKESLAGTITNLQVENIQAGVEIPAEISHVKDVARLKCDYVILNCQILSETRTVNARLEELDKISKAVALAGRLSMSAIISGNLSGSHLSHLKGAVKADEYLLSLPFFSTALIHGYVKAIEASRVALSQ